MTAILNRILLVGLLASVGYAQEPSPTTGGVDPAAVETPKRAVKLTPDLRRKLVEKRAEVAMDSEYRQLLAAAKAAQARADDFFLLRLKQAVADDKALREHVDQLLRSYRATRTNPESAR